MTFKTVLAHAEPEWGSGEALDVAIHLSRLFGAHVVGVAAEAFNIPSADFVDGSVVQLLRDEVDTDLATAQKRFMAAVEGLPAGATFYSGMDYPHVLMARHARGADLIVARRPPDDASAANLCHPADLIMEGGLPVLLAPRAPQPLRADRIVVAWKDGRAARRALADALPFMVRAQHVVLVAVCPADDQAAERTALREVADRLQRLGIKADVEVKLAARGSPLRQLEETANRIGADLIVAGAYSHSRVGEWVLGGVTQDLLIDCDRYVLFSR